MEIRERFKVYPDQRLTGRIAVMLAPWMSQRTAYRNIQRLKEELDKPVLLVSDFVEKFKIKSPNIIPREVKYIDY